MGQFIWYKTKVLHGVENAARELVVHMSHPGLEHWKSLGRFIGYLKFKYTKGIIIRKPKFLKAVMFYDSNYATYKDTRKSVSGLVNTLGGTLLIYLPKTQRTVTLSSTEADYMEFSACAQEVKFVSMLLGETTRVQNPSIIY